jgi:hypothetical protein
MGCLNEQLQLFHRYGQSCRFHYFWCVAILFYFTPLTRSLDQYHMPLTLRFPRAVRIRDELIAEDCATVNGESQSRLIRSGLKRFIQIYGRCTLRGRNEKPRRSKQRECWLLRPLLRIEQR